MMQPQQGTFSNPFTIGGIMENPQQLNQLTQNPLFNMGMGLLAHRYDANINPFTAAMQGLGQAQEQQIGAEQRERAEQSRQSLDAFLKQQAEMYERLYGPQQPPVSDVTGMPVQPEGTTTQPFADTPYGEGPQNRVLRDKLQGRMWERILGGF